MKRIQQKFKKGVASFYIVAFSSLILVIVAASFATVILSEVTRTANEDLSQSAYDSALAGIEDAKLAFSRYRKCLVNMNQSFDGVSCANIKKWMESSDDCYMVPRILGRFGPEGTEEEGEVIISDMTIDDESVVTEQAYTCVIMRTVLSDYKSNLSSNNQTRVIKVKMGPNRNANDIEKIRLNWYSTDNDAQLNFNNYRRIEGDEKWRVAFDTLDNTAAATHTAATPPTLELQIVQTASSFTLDQLMSSSKGNSTDRATLYFVPTNQTVPSGGDDTFVSIYNNVTNYVGADMVANTNNPGVLNKPFLTRCINDKTKEFACSVDIELPTPIEGVRSNDTFMLMLGLPYGQPDTDFSLEFICKGTVCPAAAGEEIGIDLDMQVLIDSTGRANDLYRRVEARLDLSGSAAPYPYYALQLFGAPDSDDSLIKTLYTTVDNDNH